MERWGSGGQGADLHAYYYCMYGRCRRIGTGTGGGGVCEREGEFAIFEAPKNGPRVAGAGGPRAGKINMAGGRARRTTPREKRARVVRPCVWQAMAVWHPAVSRTACARERRGRGVGLGTVWGAPVTGYVRSRCSDQKKAGCCLNSYLYYTLRLERGRPPTSPCPRSSLHPRRLPSCNPAPARAVFRASSRPRARAVFPASRPQPRRLSSLHPAATPRSHTLPIHLAADGAHRGRQGGRGRACVSGRGRFVWTDRGAILFSSSCSDFSASSDPLSPTCQTPRRPPLAAPGCHPTAGTGLILPVAAVSSSFTKIGA
jgi:hypothetical protein